ncbi:MAG: tetratricopeptide repeat protein [Acetobacteraceae bacterium]|nr:tetratricopeptide repeat protein [Acetobacteraceae bacterium]
MPGFHRLAAASRCCALLLALAASGCAGSGGQRAAATAAQEAEIAAAIGNGSQAVALLGRVAEQAPSDLDAQLRYARALAESGRGSEALAVAQAARARGLPAHPIDTLIGRLQIQAGDGTGAEQTFQRLVAEAPGDATALNGLGLARVLTGNLSGAEDAFRQAAARAPSDVAARNNLGLVLALEGREDQAVPMLERLRAEAPGSRRVRHNLALAYAAEGRPEAARGLLEADLPGPEAEEAAQAYAGLTDVVPAQSRTVAAASLPPESDQADAEAVAPMSRPRRHACHHGCRSGRHVAPGAVARAPAVETGESPS